MLTIATWNVNSIRARLPRIIEWLHEASPDIVLLQETKVINENYPSEEIEDLGYNIAKKGQKSYNGVAILSKFSIEDVISIKGLVDNRSNESINPEMKTGEIEIAVSTYSILNEAEPLPFVLTDRNSAEEHFRLKYLYLELRIDELQQNIITRLDTNDLIATTDKVNANEVFSFGRDHGHFGRILNQTVVSIPSLNVRNDTEITGFCFTPQDGNSLLSSIAITGWFLYPHSYQSKIQCLAPFFFDEV